jgi:hypothetical protein
VVGDCGCMLLMLPFMVVFPPYPPLEIKVALSLSFCAVAIRDAFSVVPVVFVL